MLIQVLGTGCPKCTLLQERVTAAAKETGLEVVISKVSDIERILEFGVMSTPALVIDGQVKLSGRVPGIEELKTLLVAG